MKEELLIIIFLLLGPVLDVLAFYDLPVNIVFRGLYLTGIIFLMIKNRKNLKLLSILLIFSIVEFLFQMLCLDYSVTNNISNILKFLYLPCSILYFKDFEFKKYNRDKILSIILFAYVGIFIFSYITKIGDNIYLEEEGKTGFKGIFTSINEFSAILVVLLPIVSNYLIKNKKYLLLVLSFIGTIICSLLLGTKVLLGGIVFTLIYLLYLKRDSLFFKRSKIEKNIIIVSLVLVFVSGCLLITKTRTYKNMVVQQKFFKANNILSYNYLNRVVYNDRLGFLSDNFDYFKTSSLSDKLLGIGINNEIKMVEIDIFDILFRYGIIGISLFIFMLSKIPFKKLEIKEKISLILLLIISLTSGHVLFYPNVCIYMGLLNSKNMIE